MKHEELHALLNRPIQEFIDANRNETNLGKFDAAVLEVMNKLADDNPSYYPIEDVSTVNLSIRIFTVLYDLVMTLRNGSLQDQSDWLCQLIYWTLELVNRTDASANEALSFMYASIGGEIVANLYEEM